MEHFDSLIFDLDGTLWDSSAPVMRAWNHAVGQVGTSLGGGGLKTITREDITRIMGMPHQQIFETIFPDTETKLREAIASRCYEEEIALIRREGAALFAGVTEGLVELARRYPLYIVSNCQTPYLETFFEWTGMKELFTDWECHGSTGKMKNENITLLTERHALKRPAYIGDTAGDQMAAALASVPYFHVDYGFGTARGECRHFRTFGEVVSFFLSLPSES